MRILDEIRPHEFLRAIGDGIVVLDADFKILYQNSAHELFFGAHVGKRCSDAYKCHEAVCSGCPHALAMQDGGAHCLERIFETPRGKKHVEIVASPLRNALGRVIAGVEVVRDITERRRAEEDRERIRQRETEAREAAEAAVRQHDIFLAVAAHELKTPFSALRFQLQGILRAARGDSGMEFSAQRFLDQLSIADQQAERMARLIENLLSISRISSGEFRLNIETVDLSELVHEISIRMASSFARAGCELRFHSSSPEPCMCDRLRVEEIVTNLLSNAIRYAERSPIDLSVGADMTHAILTVSDHGFGLAAEDRERIFMKYERGRTAGRRDGLGLGLFIAREIANAHGGSIEVGDTEPRGATFVLRLPLQRP